MSYYNWDHTSPENRHYHDTEWGVPVHDDIRQFEYLSLEVMQCGLSWDLMIRKRPIFRHCFAGFDYDKIATFTDKDITRILTTPGMIKSPRKIAAIIHNAQAFQTIRSEWGSFCAYLWGYTGGKSILYHHHADGYIPVTNALAIQIANDLKKRGFKFLGPIVMYSHLQACGIINDHDKNCPRFKYLTAHYPMVHRRRFLEQGVQYFGT